MNNFDEEIDRLMDENKRLRAELARLTENAQEAVGEA
jgi:hypothetical protein